MERIAHLLIFVASLILASAQSAAAERARDVDGDLTQNEYEVVSTNDSIYRSWCPYTCEDRGIPRAQCKEWKSLQDPRKCYVQDTSIPSDAISFGGTERRSARASMRHAE